MNRLIKIISASLLAAIIAALIIFLCTSCATQKKQQRKAETFYNAHPEELAKKASVMFPDIIESKTEGRTDTVTDRVYLEPETKIQYRTITRLRVDTFVKESGFKVGALQLSNDKLINDLGAAKVDLHKNELQVKDLQAGRNMWHIRFFALLVITGIYFGLRAYLKLKLL